MKKTSCLFGNLYRKKVASVEGKAQDETQEYESQMSKSFHFCVSEFSSSGKPRLKQSGLKEIKFQECASNVLISGADVGGVGDG